MAQRDNGKGPGVAAGLPTPKPSTRPGTPSVDLSSDLPRKDYMLEAGNSGLKIFGGFVVEEFDPNLRGIRGARMWREMSDTNPIVGAFLFVIFQAIAKIGWHLQPADQSPLSLLAAELFESMLEDMDHTFEEFVQEALSMIIYGYAPIEIVLKMRNGKQSDKRFSSKYDDGAIGIRKLPVRSQETILRWIMDADNNDILGVVQMPWTGGIRMIPRSKMLLFRTRSYRNNPEGRSLLRNAYRPYYFMKRIEEVEGIGIERDLAGFPVMAIPAELISAAQKKTDPDAAATLQSYQNLVKNIKRNSQEGAVIPSDTDERGKPMFELKLLASGGQRQHDTNIVIGRYMQQIATTVLADFLLLGHGSGGRGGGGAALGGDKVDLFYMAVEGVTIAMCSTLNLELVPILGDLNGIPEENRPKFYTDKPEKVDLGRLGAYVNALAASGMVLFPDRDLENYLRDVGGLPEASEETVAQQQEIQAAGGDTGPGAGGQAIPGQRPDLGQAGQQPGGPPQPGSANAQDPRMGAQGAFGQAKQAPHLLPHAGGAAESDEGM